MDKGEKNIVFGKYAAGRLLGCGAFAKVYSAKNVDSGQMVAIKVFNKKRIIQNNMMSNIKGEITTMGRLQHPNIIRLYEVLACKRKIYFVMELAKGGELYAKVTKGRFSEELSRKYFQQLISAVGYCHFRGVYHRDLKPGNLLLDKYGKLKVSDFGLAAVNDHIDGSLQTICGTLTFMAPEMLKKRPYGGAMVDVWSCGVILYVLAAGYLPFNEPNSTSMCRKISQGDYRCPNWMSSDLVRLLSRLLDTNPKTRITIDEIIHDPWFNNGGLFKGKSPEFEFPFYHDDTGSSSDDLYGNFFSVKQPCSSVKKNTSITSSMNAFDLIAFSSGLGLSRLLNQTTYNPFEDGEKFFSSLPVDVIIAKTGEVADELKLKLRRRKEDCVVDLVGPIGNFIARVEINQVTKQLVIVDVKMKRGDFMSNSNNILRDKLIPKLSQLIYSFESQPTNQMDTIHDHQLTIAAIYVD
ncbi:CBL-interacting serine/threonine-protein kinase 11-like [Spinacia oleracea]|uniref:non-specific serine/threonine protein kinase n=1 Tax=Spinacia oleracea TaxID=3562 RepID=A0A9R0HYP9_SPIOL|nr:CBL-interacting serine/threonine-protein kinase 11-like [Spinacia oleracea]